MQNPAAEQATKAIKEANNVLVTVRNNPSVDELSAAIALTLMLNHLNKHAITVFSGRVPSTLEFLQPEMAIDTNTDSLRDFIIALDKSKADKLRYKVEDNVVRIFITPYKTSITEKDLEFSQGDFNVDVVVALGVVNKEDFDQAVTTHGRILHDATVVTMTKRDMISQIGAINWQDVSASSISEMITSIVDGMGDNLLDGQIATALLTGIVAETDRFRNANTTPQVMSLSSKLMAAGANQQLIAEKLEQPDIGPEVTVVRNSDASSDGALEIAHDDDGIGKIHIDESGNLQDTSEEQASEQDIPEDEEMPHDNEGRSFLRSDKSPTLFAQDDSGTVSAQPLFSKDTRQGLDIDEYHLPPSQRTHNAQKTLEPLAPIEETQQEPVQALEIPQLPTDQTPIAITNEKVIETPAATEPASNVDVQEQTLIDLENAVNSDHLNQDGPGANVATTEPAQQASVNVDDFLGTTRAIPEPEPVPASDPAPLQAPIVEIPVGAPTTSTAEPTAADNQTPPAADEPVKQDEDKKEDESAPKTQAPPQVINPNAPPTVPPPLMPQPSNIPQFYEADGSNSNPFLNPS